MGACALASARVRDRALPRHASETLNNAEVSSEIFFSAAKDAIDKDLTMNEGFDYLRACTLLALTSIQYGQIAAMQQYLGEFFTLVSMQRFYDEKFWDSNLTKTQIETRRRIYWCTYTLDVYGAAIWDCFLRSQEIHANVRYPGDIDDESVSEEMTPQNDNHVSWLHGWNFATDLYRVLEHTLNKARSKVFRHEDRRSVDSLVFQDNSSDTNVMQTMLNMYYDLPSVFKETPAMTGDLRRDIYGYQAANIQATLQLLRMINFSMEDGPGIERKCDVASEVLSVFHSIPREYLRAMSTPLIYHLRGIGQVLASVVQHPLTESQFFRVRTSLISMADLLESLEAGLQRAAGASQGLRDEVAKLDHYMRAQRHMHEATPLRPAPLQNISHLPTLPLPASMPTGLSADFQLPPELFGDWSWAPDYGAQFYPANLE